MTLSIVGTLLLVGLVCYISSCENKPSADTNNKSARQVQDTPQQNGHEPETNPYRDLRNIALALTSEQVGIKIPTDQTKIYGVVMDWDVDKGTATLASFISGDASLYLSSGGGFIGGRGHDNVKKAAAAFVTKAEEYLTKATKTDETSLPNNGGVKFYFLTNKGRFVAQEEAKNFEDNSSQWLELFKEGNNLITELRIAAETK